MEEIQAIINQTLGNACETQRRGDAECAAELMEMLDAFELISFMTIDEFNELMESGECG